MKLRLLAVVALIFLTLPLEESGAKKLTYADALEQARKVCWASLNLLQCDHFRGKHS
jgi:hypothetical protein